jgi:hypothetical protein
MAYIDPNVSPVIGGEVEEEDISLSIPIEEIELEVLAEEIILLLKRDLWLERERRCRGQTD